MLELSTLIMMAPPSGDGQGGATSFIPTILFFVFMIGIMYMFMIRPQQKRQKEHQNMLSNLHRGDKVIISSGIHGTITDIDEKTMTLQIADNTKIRVEKSAVTAKL